MTRRNRINLGRLPSNNKTTPNREELSPIVRGRTHKRGSGLAGEIQNIGNSLFAEIIVPAIEAGVLDFLTSGISMLFNKGAGKPSQHSRRTSYNSMYTRKTKARRGSQYRRYSEPEDQIFEDVFFDNREDARLVLGKMIERTAEYGAATVGDLNNLVGLNSNATYERYGWVDLQGTRVHYTSEGYLIGFPEPEYL